MPLALYHSAAMPNWPATRFSARLIAVAPKKKIPEESTSSMEVATDEVMTDADFSREIVMAVG
jgi:hypothetical protein